MWDDPTSILILDRYLSSGLLCVGYKKLVYEVHKVGK